MTPPGPSRGNRALSILILSMGLAGEAWLNLLGWAGLGGLAVAASVIAVVLLVRGRRRIVLRHLPISALAFVGLAALSLIWSAYPVGTALGLGRLAMICVLSLYLALTLSWRELLDALGATLHLVLWLSLAFELWVAVVVRSPVLPFWTALGEDPPLLAMWSRNLLFSGGPIQGVLGNSGMLAIAAAIAVIVFAIQIGDRGAKRAPIAGLAAAVLVTLLTRSSTMTLALIAAAGVLVLAVLVRRAAVPQRWRITLGGLVVGAGVLLLGLSQRATVLQLLGKSSDLTGRTEIWGTVLELAQQRPVVGWGWIGYWIPWVEPLGSLVVRNGVGQLHAHNTWLDLYLQLGIIGVIVFGFLMLGIVVHSWWLAVDRAPLGPAEGAPYSALQLLPLLVTTVLLVLSLSDSRLLMEGALPLLLVFAIKLRTRDLESELSVRQG